MAIRTRDEILNMVNERFSEDSNDDTLTFIEDITDTLNDYETKVRGDGVDWKQKYEENDSQWRAKYRDRFFSKTPETEMETIITIEEEKQEDNSPKTFEDLFKKE